MCRFRSNVLNIIGYSTVYSPTLSVLFAEIPEAPSVPVYVDRSGGDSTTGLEPFITISWDEPTDNGGIDILGYLVSINMDGGEFTLAYDGSVEPNILQNTFLGLNPGSLYSFKVWSRNELGTSLTASEILEVYAATYPFKMDSPVQVSVIEAALLSSILLTWTSTPYNGALQILGFYLQINSGYDTDFTDTLYQVDNTETTYQFENLIAGATYAFRIAAYNRLEADNQQYDDELNFSDSVEYVIANVPDQITDLTQSLLQYESGKAKLIWTAPYDNGSDILYYIVSRDVGSGVFFQVYNGTTNAFTDTELEAGNSYNYKVKALNIIGYNDDSEVLTAIAGQYPDKITTVTIELESQLSLMI